MTFDDVIDTHAEPDLDEQGHGRKVIELERGQVEREALADLGLVLEGQSGGLALKALRSCILDREHERSDLLERLEAQARRPDPARVGEVAVEVIALREARQRIDGVCRVLEGMHEPPPGHVLDGLDEAMRAWAVSVISSVERIALAVNPAMLPPAP